MPVAKTATAILIAASLCICTIARAQSELEDVGKVKDYYAEWLSSIPGVTDVGVGEGPGGAPEIELHADVITDQMRRLPSQLNGFPVRIIKNPRNADDSPETYSPPSSDNSPKSGGPASAPSATAPAAPNPPEISPPNL
jgi:hypothetical protein